MLAGLQAATVSTTVFREHHARSWHRLIEGSGGIEYEAEVDPAKVKICHCLGGQTLPGSAFRVTIAAPPEKFRLKSGEPAVYQKFAGSSGLTETKHSPLSSQRGRHTASPVGKSSNRRARPSMGQQV